MPWASIQMHRSGQWLNQAAHHGSGKVNSQGLKLGGPRAHTRMAWTPCSNPAAYFGPGLVSQGKGTRRLHGPPP